MKNKFTLLGRKLGHSLSPEIHALISDYEYTLSPVEPENLNSFFERRDIDGFNVTVPYKLEAFARCGKLSSDAEKSGCVNTCIYMPDGTLYGDNTDIFGFEYLIENAGCDFEGKKVLILGSGGASHTVKYVAGKKKAGETIVVSRTGKDNYGNISNHYDADIIVNTTPVGMFPGNGASVINPGDFGNCEFIFDLIYNPLRTKLIQQGEKCGIKCFNGLGMLVAQAVRSSEIFTGTPCSDDKIEKIKNGIEKGFRNITLIGMPGSGKSTIGKMLAEKTGREFIDTDAELEKGGMVIPEFIGKQGEEAFRRKESEVIKNTCRMNGKVIATGGGSVIREENRTAVRENSLVVFLDAPVENLSTENRPLSSDICKVNELYKNRIDYYRSTADVTVETDTDPEITLERVIECICL